MIPTVEDLKSAPLVHRNNDLFNPPGLANALGTVQVAEDITGFRGVYYPPYGGSEAVTGGLYLDGCYFPALCVPITYIWYPDRIVRTAEYRGLYLESITSLVVGKQAVIVSLTIENRRGEPARLPVQLRLQGNVIKSMDKWANFIAPQESDNLVDIDQGRQALLFNSRHSTACALQGFDAADVKVNRLGGELVLELQPGERRTISLVYVIGASVREIGRIYDSIIHNIDGHLEQARQDWNDELAAVFIPGNERYSGSLPILYTDDEAIRRLYLTGIMGMIYFKRDNPHSVYGRAYDTLLPRYWQTVTFIWDYSISSMAHALLDPAVMRKYLEYWMGLDTHKHFGTDYLTGGPVGPWYAVNDFAMLWMSNDYLRWSGQLDWLDSTVSPWQTNGAPDRQVLDYLSEYAGSWRNFKADSGLADYGGIDNLLECVSTYIHQVASLNAGNVFNLRFLAGLLEARGEKSAAVQLRSEAQDLLRKVQSLYVPGGGYWKALHPGGEAVEVRHCYDFITTLNTIADDLTNGQKREMARYFREELQTEVWMRALSPRDQDAIFSIRPDHQWNGAYPAWPAQTASGLYRLGETELAFNWLQGLAASANQGPFGQAHFTEQSAPREAGGALKCPPNMPYITDWAVSSGGCWVSLIIESIFGVKATIHEGITAVPQFGSFDPRAELHDLLYQGRRYHVDREGLKKA
ncbi:MAG: hypothetical protein ABIA75_05430 [Candidatus Neomarinimicrobiota bacterium]